MGIAGRRGPSDQFALSPAIARPSQLEPSVAPEHARHAGAPVGRSFTRDYAGPGPESWRCPAPTATMGVGSRKLGRVFAFKESAVGAPVLASGRMGVGRARDRRPGWRTASAGSQDRPGRTHHALRFIETDPLERGRVDREYVQTGVSSATYSPGRSAISDPKSTLGPRCARRRLFAGSLSRPVGASTSSAIRSDSPR